MCWKHFSGWFNKKYLTQDYCQDENNHNWLNSLQVCKLFYYHSSVILFQLLISSTNLYAASVVWERVPPLQRNNGQTPAVISQLLLWNYLLLSLEDTKWVKLQHWDWSNPFLSGFFYCLKLDQVGQVRPNCTINVKIYRKTWNKGINYETSHQLKTYLQNLILWWTVSLIWNLIML